MAETVNSTINITGGTTTLAGDIIKAGVSGTGTGSTVASATLSLNGGTLDLGGHNIGDAINIINSVVLAAGTLQNVGEFNNGAVLAKTTGGTLILEGTNTYTGGTSTAATGTLQVGSGGATGTLGGGTVANSGTLAFNRSNAYSVSNVITSGGGVTQIGSGTTTLSGASTYSGGTVVSNGVLLATNVGSTAGTSSTGSAAVTVASGGTLGGGGSVAPAANNFNIAGAVTVASGGTLAPGTAGVGVLTVNNNVTFVSGSTYKWDLATPTPTPATGVTNFGGSDAAGGQDVLAVTGAGTFGGSFTLKVVESGVTVTPGQLYSFTIGTTASGTASVGTVGVAVNSTDAPDFQNWFDNTPNAAFTVTASGGNVYLNLTPEPGTVLGLAAAGMGLAGWVRRRRNKAKA